MNASHRVEAFFYREVRYMRFIQQLLHFGYHQAMSCLFPAVIFLALALSKIVEVPGLPRYDFILLICLFAQLIMYKTGLETWDELKVITVFHVIGLALELYKVHMGSWAYPEPGYSKFYGVPLYSGFMYASVASYIVQSWRRHDLKITNWPKSIWAVCIGAGIYFNFYTHHFIYDFRWVLSVALFFVFARTMVYFTVNHTRYKMPMILSFFLIGFFIWIAENISTFFDGYRYPNQDSTWELVHIGKISSWFLLVVVSVIIVAQLKHVKEGEKLVAERSRHLSQ